MKNKLFAINIIFVIIINIFSSFLYNIKAVEILNTVEENNINETESNNIVTNDVIENQIITDNMPPRFTAGGEVFNMDYKKKTDKGWKRAFDKDNSFNLILSRIGTLIIANILFVVGCIPIVTIGVSLSALNAVMFDFQRNDDVKVSSVFFASAIYLSTQ